MTQKILIALPCYRTMEAEAVNSLCQLLAWSHHNLDGYTVDVKIAARQQVVLARNGLADYALANGYDHLFFIDDDHVWPSDIISRLLKHANDAVSALYFRRVPPFGPVAFQGVALSSGAIEYQRLPVAMGGLVEVDATGMGAFLLKVDVLKKLKQPFFVLEDRTGSDIHFCRKIRQAGVSIYVDYDTVVGHLGDRPIIDQNFCRSMIEEPEVAALFQTDLTVTPAPQSFDEFKDLSDADRIKLLSLRVKYYPGDYGARRDLGLLYKTIGKPDQALQELDEALKRARQKKDKKYCASILFHQGLLCKEQGDREKALAAFSHCLEYSPDNRKAARYLEELQHAR